MAKKTTTTGITGKALLDPGAHEGITVTGEVWVPATEGQYKNALKFIPTETEAPASPSSEE